LALPIAAPGSFGKALSSCASSTRIALTSTRVAAACATGPLIAAIGSPAGSMLQLSSARASLSPQQLGAVCLWGGGIDLADAGGEAQHPTDYVRAGQVELI